MAPQRPSSPTSLLWAHQLKREHGYLLKRMQDLESTCGKQDSRIKAAETTARSASGVDLATLAEQVKDLEGPGLRQRLTQMEAEIAHKLQQAKEHNGGMVSQIAALQRDARMGEEERKVALNKDKALLKRIGEVEEGLRKYEQSLGMVGMKANGQQMESIKKQLVELSAQVSKEGLKMKRLEESIARLEYANDNLHKVNAELMKQVMSQSEADEQPNSNAEADMVVPATPDGGHSTHRDRAPKNKPVPRHIPVSQAPLKPGERKPHRWSGGGADRDIVASGLSMENSRKRRRSRDVGIEQPPKKQAREEVVRSGKGWIEVVEKPKASKQDDGRRRIDQESDDEAHIESDRRSVKQRNKFPSLRDDEADLLSQRPGMRQTRAHKHVQAPVKTAESRSRRSSLTSTPKRTRGTTEAAAARYSHDKGRQSAKLDVTRETRPVQPERRRIIQDDDD